MSHLIASHELVHQLRGITTTVEVRDADGKLLGHYTPVGGRVTEEEHARWQKLFDIEKAERTLATQRDQGRSLAEVMRELKSPESRN